nr:hypothetical protein [Candidatus Njordarchaeota archaeon]
MTAPPYAEMIDEDNAEHARCPLKWNCEKCDKSLCLRIVAAADLPTRCWSIQHNRLHE